MPILTKITEKKLNELGIGYHWDSIAAGLVVFINQQRERKFIFKYSSQSTGNMEEILIGTDIKLSAARQVAKTLARLVIQGEDPKQPAAQEVKSSITVNESCARYLQIRNSEWRNEKHRINWIQSVEDYILPVIGSKMVNDITTQDVLAVLNPIWVSKPVTANRVRQRIKLTLDWAVANGFRDGMNPADMKTGVGQLLPKVKKIHTVEHHPAFPWREAPQLVSILKSKPGHTYRALEMLLLTAARTNEVIHARWDEFDLHNAVWTVPAKRTKNFRDHRVPITARLSEILALLKKDSFGEYIFTNPMRSKPMNLASPRTTFKRLGYDRYTPHGFRSTFRDWAAEKVKFRREAIELSLGHTVAHGAEAAYWRSDLFSERVRIMKAWEKYLYG